MRSRCSCARSISGKTAGVRYADQARCAERASVRRQSGCDAIHDLPPLTVPKLDGIAAEPALRVLMPAARDEAQDQVRAGGGIGLRSDFVLSHREAQRLLQRGFQPVMELVD